MALKQWALGTSSQDVDVGVGNNDCDGYIIVQITGTIGSGTVAFKGYMRGQAKVGNTAVDATSNLAASDAVTLPYYATATGTLTTGATAANALGIYRVWMPARVSLLLSYTAGGGSNLVATTQTSII